MTRMLGRLAHRSVLVGPNGDRRRCVCRECDVLKPKGAQRAYEKRQWLSEVER